MVIGRPMAPKKASPIMFRGTASSSRRIARARNGTGRRLPSASLRTSRNGSESETFRANRGSFSQAGAESTGNIDLMGTGKLELLKPPRDRDLYPALTMTWIEWCAEPLNSIDTRLGSGLLVRRERNDARIGSAVPELREFRPSTGGWT